MAFKFDYENLEYEKVTPGVYEVIVQNVSEQYTPTSGKKHLGVSLIIRNDVQQLHQNAIIVYNIWTTDKPEVKTIEGYVEFSLALMCKACGLPQEINVGSVNELSKLWINKPIKITVTENEYNGKMYANVSKVEESLNKAVNHQFRQNKTPSSTFVPNDNNDMIPF